MTWLLGDAARLGRVGDLLLHERSPHVAGADRIDRDPMLGDLERDRLGQPGNAVLGRDVRGLERTRDQRMRGGDIDHPPPVLRFHRRQSEPYGMKRGRQVERDDRVPLVDREFVDRRDELDARVVDEDVDRTELSDRLAHHRLDLRLLRQVGAVEAHLDAMLGGNRLAERLDFVRVAEAVENDVRAFLCECPGNA
jgi:hypothetical protein